MGDILSTVGDVQYRGKCSVRWGDIMSTVGYILSTVGDIMCICTVGGYHDARGGYRVYCGDIIFCNLSGVGDIMIHEEIS